MTARASRIEAPVLRVGGLDQVDTWLNLAEPGSTFGSWLANATPIERSFLNSLLFF